MVSAQIYEALVGKIRRGEIKQGEKIILAQVGKEFGVSSTPVRDAIAMLRVEGFLEPIIHTSAKVITIGEKERAELQEVYSSLHCVVVEKALKYNPEELYSHLKRYYEIYQAMLSIGEREAACQAAHDFINSIYNGCGNKMLLDLTCYVYGRLTILFGDYDGILTEPNILPTLKGVLDAVQRKDAKEAQKMLCRYTDKMFENLKKREAMLAIR